MKKQTWAIWAITIVLAGLIGLLWGWNLGDGVAGDTSVLAQAQAEIQEKFIGAYDEVAVQEAAIDAMVASLGDEWSYYLTSEEYQSYRESISNAYVGIGVTVVLSEEWGGLLVQTVYDNSPAQEAGIEVGDCIVSADGASFEGLTLDEAKAMVVGEDGTEVTLTVRAQSGDTREVVVARGEVQVVPVSYQMLDGQVGYVKIDNFDAGAAEQSMAAVEALIEEGAVSLVFDVRNNPGGLLTELLSLLDYMLPEGPTFIAKDYRGKETVYTSDSDCVDLPVAILAHGSSYSAAEFFAAALQEAERAIVVGTQTYGKGYSQIPVPLSDGSALILSTASYYTAGGVSLIGVGVTPDVTVELTEEEALLLRRGELAPEADPQLQAALAQ